MLSIVNESLHPYIYQWSRSSTKLFWTNKLDPIKPYLNYCEIVKFAFPQESLYSGILSSNRTVKLTLNIDKVSKYVGHHLLVLFVPISQIGLCSALWGSRSFIPAQKENFNTVFMHGWEWKKSHNFSLSNEQVKSVIDLYFGHNLDLLYWIDSCDFIVFFSVIQITLVFNCFCSFTNIEEFIYKNMVKNRQNVLGFSAACCNLSVQRNKQNE